MLAKLKSPVSFLTFTNLVSAAISFVSGMLVARWIGSAAYGVMGIIFAINTSALNFVDIRLQDLVSKLYYAKDTPGGMDASRFRVSIIQSTMLCYGGLSIIFLFAGLAANHLLCPLFTTTPLDSAWFLASSVGISVTYLVNPIGTLLRLSGRFHLLGWQAIGVSVLSTSIMLGCVWRSRNLDGYYAGFVYSNLVGAAISSSIAAWVWIRLDKLPILGQFDLTALREFSRHRRFLFWGNLLGYVKLGHRAADVLIVGWFCDDRLTGLYKLARTLTDRLYLLYDALNQVYFPTFLRKLADGDFPGYRSLARRTFLGALALTAVLLGAEAAVLPLFTRLVLREAFIGVEPLIMVMTLPFFFVTGMYIWLWPIFVHHTATGRFTLVNTCALVVQHLVGVGGWLAYRMVESFPVGYLAYYVLLIGAACLLARTHAPLAIPFLARPRKG